ncbi:MAG: flagellar hook protein FlgE [Acidobacteriota bacterium]|nr:flagellar hook protein FlgE [Acidobacteriota bacterium]
MGSFSIALTGLEADTVQLNTIGNNLANLNTSAFKTQNSAFEDLFYQQIGTSGSNDAIQVGVGTRVSQTVTNYTQGSLSTTGNSTDMALSGAGFFVVQQAGSQQLTRAGNFELDSSGNLITMQGASVMGYGATAGVVNTNSGLVPLQMPVGTTQAAHATSNVTLTANLNAGATVGTSFTSPVTVYDSLGTTHSATITYTLASPNTWNYAIALPAGDATGVTGNTGTLTFNSSGQLVTPASNVSSGTFTGLTDGASNLSFKWNLYDAKGNPLITQSTAASSTTATNQDGFASGVYQSFSVDASGVITASFSNGQTEAVGQVAVASIANQQGLVLAGNNNYTTSPASGLPSIGLAGTGGRGTIVGSALEQSNVDISSEFADLIVAQRAFEANSKTMTTFDTVTQDTLGMIR